MALKLYIRHDGLIAHENPYIVESPEWSLYTEETPIHMVPVKEVSVSEGLDVEYASKDELVAFAEKFFQVELDKRKSLSALRTQVKELIGV